MPSRSLSRQSGNVLFLILIAVALFAVLTYAVTKSSRGGADSGKKETADAQAASILQYAAQIKAEVDRLRTINGLDYNQVDFNNNFSNMWGSGGTFAPKGKNPNCTAIQARKQCAVFSYNGGRVTARDFYAYSQNAAAIGAGHPKGGEAQFFSQFITDVGTASPEIVMYVMDLKKDICDAINTKLGLPLADAQAFVDSTYFGERFYYTDATNTAKPLPFNATAYKGQNAFCMRSQYGYVFINVLIPR